MLPLALALAVASSPLSPAGTPHHDLRLEGCFLREKGKQSAVGDLTTYFTLCLFPDGTATYEVKTAFISFMGSGGAQDGERETGRWSFRRGVLAFDGDDGRRAWRARVLDDGLRLDGEWYGRSRVAEAGASAPGPEEGAEAADEADLELTPEQEQALEKLRTLLLDYVRAHGGKV